MNGTMVSTAIDQDLSSDEAEQRLHAIVSRLNPDTLWETFIEELQRLRACSGHPIVCLVTTVLREAPLESRAELDGWIHYARPKQAERLGRALMRVIGRANWACVQRVQGEGRSC